MVEAPVEDGGDHHDVNNAALAISSPSRGGGGRPNQHHYGLSPRQLRLLQAERRRRAAASSSAATSSASALGTDAASRGASSASSITGANSPTLPTTSSVLLPSQQATSIRYSTPPSEKKKMSSSLLLSSCNGTPHKQKQHNTCNDSDEVTTTATTTTSATAVSSSLEDCTPKRMWQLKKISPSSTTALTNNNHDHHHHHHVNDDEKEHDCTIVLSDEDNIAREEESAPVKVSERIRAFNHGSSSNNSNSPAGSRGAAVGKVTRWNTNGNTTGKITATTKRIGGNICNVKAREIRTSTTVSENDTSGKDDMNSMTIGEKSILKEEEVEVTKIMTDSVRGPLHEQNNGMSGGHHLKYYRILFNGMILILPHLDHDVRRQNQQTQQNQQRLGMHSDVGHATGSTAPTDCAEACFDDTTNACCDFSDIYIGYGDIVGTKSPEIMLPINNCYELTMVTEDTPAIADRHQPAMLVRAIRVDTILTAGYYAAIDDGSAFQKQQRRQRQQPPQQPHRQGPYGYILLSDINNQSIAEPLPTAAANAILSSCKRGSFMYRVAASSPVPVLSGPSTDATGLGMGLLPGTVHEVSLRISVPLSPVNDDNEITGSGEAKDTLVDDADASEIQFLRLAQRRGWVADRSVSAMEQKLRVSYLMRDVTNDDAFRGRFNHPTLMGPSDCNSHGGLDMRLPDASLLTNAGDNSSLNPSTMNSVANSSYYSSVVASSVATPAIIKSRRRHNRRRPRTEDIERTQALSISSVVQHAHRSTGESFEEAGSSVTGDGSSEVSYSGGGFSIRGEGHLQSAKRLYLIRVIAPLGLKILDNTNFQVSSLMHSPALNTSNAWSSSISPFSRTNAMISSSADNSPTTTTVRKENTTRVRIFARGQIFEACQRMEVSSESTLYTNGHGLIKLADGSGWAIVPYQDDLIAQFKSENGGHSIEFAENGNKIAAYEEIGNAFLPAVQSSQLAQPTQIEVIASDRRLKDTVWLRVVAPPNGARVLLPPSRNPSSNGNVQVKKKELNAAPPKDGGHDKMKHSSSYDSETASSVSFLDSVWNKITPVKESEMDHGLRRQTPVIPVIPCGMVIPVEPWERSTNSINFSRLYNGQGWIPRRLGEEIFAYVVDTPDIRIGSFWFRVSSRSGVDVRHGPSLSAPIIKSEHGATFRFECGEFLRASEVITVFEKSKPSVECYAKLFRRNNHLKDNNSDQSLLNRFTSLNSFATHGEWVQVHGHGELFLEECAATPTIVRSRDGLQYTMTCDGGDKAGLHVYAGPSLQADIVRELNCEGKIFLVTEKVSCASEDASWLRLKSGGWVCSIGRNGKSVVRALHDNS